MYVCMSVCLYVCMYVYIALYIILYMYVYYIYICVCVCENQFHNFTTPQRLQFSKITGQLTEMAFQLLLPLPWLVFQTCKGLSFTVGTKPGSRSQQVSFPQLREHVVVTQT